jgi:4-aminobutyrate aminotransferase-like enzyme
VDAIETDGLVENAAEVGAYFKQRLEELKSKRDDIAEVRGIGLMVALQLDRKDAAAIAAACLQNGLVVNAIGESIIRFLPPLIVQKEHVDSAVEILVRVLGKT